MPSAVTASRPRAKKPGHYHHGDLRNALIDAGIDLVAEKGVRGFTFAEASRRVGVAPSAPYRHFADREALLVAVAIRGVEALIADLEKAKPSTDPVDRFDALVAAYIAFADEQRPLFEALLAVSGAKERHPELEVAVEPLRLGFFEAAMALTDGDEKRASDLTLAVMAVAHGHAALLGERAFESAKVATDRAQKAIHAVVAGRDQLWR